MVQALGEGEVPFIRRDVLAKAFGDPAAVVAFEAINRAVAANSGSGDTLDSAKFVVLEASGSLSEERVLTADTGVTLDVTVDGVVKLTVDAAAILNALAAIILTKPVDVQAALRCDSLRIDATPSASTTASTHSLPINLNGTAYYLRLSATA